MIDYSSICQTINTIRASIDEIKEGFYPEHDEQLANLILNADNLMRYIWDYCSNKLSEDKPATSWEDYERLHNTITSERK